MSDTDQPEPRYPRDFDPGTSHAHAVELIERSGIGAGLILDIGCGHGPNAEPLAALGYTYVGLDIDRQGLADLAGRGFETHELDLLVSEARLAKKLRELVADRDVAAVFALDVLEHLVDPAATVRSVAKLAPAHPAMAMVVSIPNVTHFDIAARLLLGRWEMTTTGLLDDTHLRFFSGDSFDRLLSENGWREVDAHDTIALHSDQFGLEATPALQPGAPLRNLLWRLRGDADPYAFTYQFVRRFEPASTEPAPSQELTGDVAPFASVVVRIATDDDVVGLPSLLTDLVEQHDTDFEVVVLVTKGLLDGVRPLLDSQVLGAVRVVEDVPDEFASRNAGMEVATGRYLCFADGRDRVGPRWIEAIRRGAGDLEDPLRTDAVVRVDAASVPGCERDETRDGSFPDVIADREAVVPDGFDLLRAGPLGTTALTAYAVPASVVTTVGLRFQEAPLNASPTVFVARAVELCGLRGVSDLQVVVPTESARPGEADLDPLRDALCTWPYLFDGGGFARFVQQRRESVASISEAERLRTELEDTQALLSDSNEEREALRAHIDAIFATRTFRMMHHARGVYARLRELRSRR